MVAGTHAWLRGGVVLAGVEGADLRHADRVHARDAAGHVGGADVRVLALGEPVLVRMHRDVRACGDDRVECVRNRQRSGRL
jgi:hypothetical protein